MTTCDQALVSNYTNQVANWDADITHTMNVINALKEYSLAKNSQAGDITDVRNKYAGGIRISPSYSSDIPDVALQAAGINGHSDGAFYNNHVSMTGSLASCPSSTSNSSACCLSVGEVNDRLCCACRQNSHCYPCSGTGCNYTPTPTDDQCNLLSTNLFQTYIDREIGEINDNVNTLQTTWRDLNGASVNNLPLANITCCQQIIFGNVNANSSTVRFDGITNTCTS